MAALLWQVEKFGVSREDECGRKIGGAPMVRTNEGCRLNLPGSISGKVWGAVGLDRCFFR